MCPGACGGKRASGAGRAEEESDRDRGDRGSPFWMQEMSAPSQWCRFRHGIVAKHFETTDCVLVPTQPSGLAASFSVGVNHSRLTDQK